MLSECWLLLPVTVGKNNTQASKLPIGEEGQLNQSSSSGSLSFMSQLKAKCGGSRTGLAFVGDRPTRLAHSGPQEVMLRACCHSLCLAHPTVPHQSSFHVPLFPPCQQPLTSHLSFSLWGGQPSVTPPQRVALTLPRRPSVPGQTWGTEPALDSERIDWGSSRCPHESEDEVGPRFLTLSIQVLEEE